MLVKRLVAILVVAGLVMRREPAAPPSRPGTTVAVETPAQIEPRPAPAPGPLIAAPPRPVSSRPSGRTVEAIRMPRIGNVFGAATGQLSATTVADAPAPGEIPDASGQRSPELLGPAPPIVIREITIVPLEVEQLRVPPIGPPR